MLEMCLWFQIQHAMPKKCHYERKIDFMGGESMDNFGNLGMIFVDSFSDHEDRYSLPNLECGGNKKL